MKYVGLLDCNNFFVSCERLFRPDLAKKPVVVLSSNDGCVVARSKEVKELGIPMGVPHFKVKRELETAGVVVFSSNFGLYRDLSARVMSVLREVADEVEQYSVDEAFFSLETNERSLELSLEIVKGELARIKQSVERQVGVPVTVGVAKTKTVAKCATELGKRGAGTMMLEGEAWRQVRESFPLVDVWGIGGKTAAKMREAGLHTAADLVAADRGRIEELFGAHGLRLQAELAEQPATAARKEDDLQASVMSTRSFQKNVSELSVLEDAVAYHTARVAEELREMDAVTGCVRVMIRPSRHNDWALRGGIREAFLTLPTADTRTLLREAHALTRALYEPGVPYKKAGVIVSSILPSDASSLSLFATPKDATDALFSIVDGLNRKFGKDTLTVGRIGGAAKWQSGRAHISPQYTTNWNEIPRVAV